MKHNLKRFRIASAMMAVAIPLMGYGSFPAAAEPTTAMTHIEEKTIESTDPSAEVDFDQSYEHGTNQYQLSGVDTQIIDSWPEVEEIEKKQQYEPFFDITSAEEYLPSETIEVDGTTYYLKTSEVITETVEARTEYGTTEIRYDSLEYIDELPERGRVVVSDSLTGKEYSEELPRSKYKVVNERWESGFSFDVKIYSYDADTYLLGTLEIPHGSNLIQYEQEFLNQLGLDSDYYRISSIVLSGEPYEVDGELVQDAVASGTKRTVDVVATYEGSISLPSAERYYYSCIYSNIPPNENVVTIYKIKATATYKQLEELPEEPKSDSFWDRLLNFIREHPAVAIVCILLFIFVVVLLLVLMILKKRRDRENDKYKNTKERGKSHGKYSS